MIYSSLAVLAMSASAAVSPLSNLVHFHPKAAPHDTRVSVLLVNTSNSFRDVKVDGHAYTMHSHGTLTIKAPAGTKVYAESQSFNFKRGDVMLELNPAIDKQTVNVI